MSIVCVKKAYSGLWRFLRGSWGALGGLLGGSWEVPLGNPGSVNFYLSQNKSINLF